MLFDLLPKLWNPCDCLLLRLEPITFPNAKPLYSSCLRKSCFWVSKVWCSMAYYRHFYEDWCHSLMDTQRAALSSLLFYFGIVWLFPRKYTCDPSHRRWLRQQIDLLESKHSLICLFVLFTIIYQCLWVSLSFHLFIFGLIVFVFSFIQTYLQRHPFIFFSLMIT